MSGGKLPEGWTEAPVSLVVSLIRGVTYKKEQAINYRKDDYLPLIRANNIQNGKFDTTDLVFVPKNLIKESQKISPEDIVIAMSSGSKSVVGKSAHQHLPFECSFGAFCGVLRPEKLIFLSFIAYFTKSSFYQNKILSLSADANINNIKPASFDLINIPIPSFAEQKIIAEKLDTLLAQVDSTKVRLKQILKILKRFRQAVLAAAVSGKLAESWRNEQDTNLSKWENTFFENICTEITVGYVGKMLYRYQSEGIPFLRSQNVRGFKFSDKNLLYITESFHKEIFKSRLTLGDLAIVRSGAPGTTCVIPNSLPVANYSDLVIARPSEKLDSSFGCIFMNSNVAKINVSENRVGYSPAAF